MEGSICTDYRCVCAHAANGDSAYGTAVFKRDFRGGGIGGENPPYQSFACGDTYLFS
jgi:hypothetical protein